MEQIMNKLVNRWLAFGLLASASCGALAQDPAASYPNKQVRIIVAFPPGQASDVWGRRLAEKLTLVAGHPFIVENRAGAGGQIGTSYVAKSTADGYTLLLGSNGNLATPAALYKDKLPFNPVRDFVAVSLFGKVPQILIASATYAPSTVKEFITAVQASPVPINYASPGNGTTSHLAMELLAERANLKVEHIPYNGGPPAYIDLIAGRVPVMFDSVVGARTHLQSGRVKVIAVGAPNRTPSLPNAPTLDEAGYGPFDASAWTGIVAPAGTPKAIVDKLSRWIAQVMATEEMKKYMIDQGGEAAALTPEEFSAHLSSEIVKWTRVVDKANIRPN
jgi:tripartite-type tricarboxylate transporter receptor subunit TctC